MSHPPHASTGGPAAPAATAPPAYRDVPPSLLRVAPRDDLWRVLFDASPVACSIVDIASGALIVNRAYRALLGIPDDEDVTIGHVRRRAHPDEIDELNERFGALDRGEVDRVELDRRYVRDDGSVIWGHLVTTLVRGPEGEPVAVVGQMEDITDRVDVQRRLEMREARFRSLVQNAIDSVVVVDADGLVRYGTAYDGRLADAGEGPRGGAGVSGGGAGGGAPRWLTDLVHPDDAPMCRSLLEYVSATPFARTGLRVRLRGPNRGERIAEAVATNLLDDDDVGGIVVSLRDVTETQQQLRTIREQAALLDEQNRRLSEQAQQLVLARDRAEQASKLHAARFEAGFEHSPIGIAVVAADGTVERVNPALGRMLGEAPEVLTGRSLADLVELGPGPGNAPLEDLRRRRAPAYTAEARCRRRDGAVRWAEVHIVALHDDAGGPAGFFAQLQDITERRRSARALAHQATHDSLTGLANRHRFLSESPQVVGRARTGDEEVALLFVDVDRFKTVNDSLGHSVGDRLLRELARRIAGALPGAEIARLGGDEFGVMALVPRGEPDAAQQLADRLHEACGPPFDVGGHTLQVSLSIGIVCSGDAEIDTEDLLRRADAAMYRAKAAGRSTSRFLDEGTLATLHARFELSTELDRALERDELFLRYQPEIDLATGEVVAVEALLRWRHRRRGELTAARFIGAGEENGRIVGISAWVQRQAMAQAARWPRRADGRRIVTRINLAPHQLNQDRLAARTAELLDELDLAPGDVCFEVPESALLAFGDAGRRNLGALAETGVSLALDEFGAGPSSLAQLKEIPARTLKIAMGFVQGLPHDRRDQAIVATVLDLADRLGLDAVAAGVETRRQATILEALGCRRAQGFLFGPPTAPAEIERRLRRPAAPGLPVVPGLPAEDGGGAPAERAAGQ